MDKGPEQTEASSSHIAPSRDMARQLLERVVRDDSRLPTLRADWWKPCAAQANRAILDEEIVRELVQAMLLEFFNIPLRAGAAVSDVAAAVAHSIYEDAAARERVQSWWARSCRRGT